MTLAIGIGVVGVLAIGRWVLWWWGARKVDAPLTDHWLAAHRADTTKEQWWSGK